MIEVLNPAQTRDSLPLTILGKGHWDDFFAQLPEKSKKWVEGSHFKARSGQICVLPSDDGAVGRAIFIIEDEESADAFVGASLPTTLPPVAFHVENAQEFSKSFLEKLCFSWGIGAYQFTRYKTEDSQAEFAQLICPDGVNLEEVEALISGTSLVRDLITTPASDMGPADLADIAEGLAEEFGAACSVIVGDDLLDENFPMIHAVGRAATEARAPRLIDLTWGEADHPKVTLVGKGVVFDTGGLDLKPSSGMLMMKKDMGGAAHVLGAARAIMLMNLPVRLRVLIPAVENAVSGDAFRPLDVLSSRKGLTVEVGNTDAEGRLVLADALTMACEENPDLIVDFATLTGAARVALGTELPALFCNDKDFAKEFLAAAEQSCDLLWQLPLHQPYKKLLDSPVADMNNVSSGGYGGAITAALFLQQFVNSETAWAHIDVMAYNVTSKPGRPVGGEAMGMRALYSLIRERYTK